MPVCYDLPARRFTKSHREPEMAAAQSAANEAISRLATRKDTRTSFDWKNN